MRLSKFLIESKLPAGIVGKRYLSKEGVVLSDENVFRIGFDPEVIWSKYDPVAGILHIVLDRYIGEAPLPMGKRGSVTHEDTAK